MESEAGIREWRDELIAERQKHGDIPSIFTATSAAIDTLSWVLGDTGKLS